jgi:hypothetical protein
VARVTLDITTLGLCFLAFGYPISLGTLFTGYSLIQLLSALAALPGDWVWPMHRQWSFSTDWACRMPLPSWLR